MLASFPEQRAAAAGEGAAVTASDGEPGQVAESDRKRPRTPVAVLIAAAILILVTLSYFARGILLLFSLDVLERTPSLVSQVAGALTPEGRLFVLACFYLAFGVLALVILVGFFRRKRWAWTAAMTWTAASLALNLVSYFEGEPDFLTMLAAVVMMLVLNQTAVHRAFDVQRDRSTDD
jgi:uncharacterized membrane protein